MVGNLAEIRTSYLSDMTLKQYSYKSDSVEQSSSGEADSKPYY
jgi:hypothetical protein